MTLTEKLPLLLAFLLRYIAFCETKVTGPRNVSDDIADFSLGENPENNATFIALSRTLDPLMAKGWVLMLDSLEHMIAQRMTPHARMTLKSLIDLFPDEMLTKL